MLNAGVLTFQEFAVRETLRAKNDGEAILKTWAEIANQDFQFEDEDEDLNF